MSFLEDCPVFIALVALYFLPLFCLVDHQLYAGVLFVLNLYEHLMFPQSLEMPFVQLKHISNAVEAPVRLKEIGVL